MSTVIVDEIQGRRDLNHVVTMPSGEYFNPGVGHVVQVAWKEDHQHGTYNAYNDATRNIDPLNLDFACKFSNSLILVQWWLFFESHYNIIFRPRVNSADVAGGTYSSYNTNSSSRWSGMAPGVYEQSWDQNSTPIVQHMAWMYAPGTTANRTYNLGIRSSNGSNYQLRLNRAWGSYSDNYEAGVSTVLIQEIKQ